MPVFINLSNDEVLNMALIIDMHRIGSELYIKKADGADLRIIGCATRS